MPSSTNSNSNDIVRVIRHHPWTNKTQTPTSTTNRERASTVSGKDMKDRQKPHPKESVSSNKKNEGQWDHSYKWSHPSEVSHLHNKNRNEKQNSHLEHSHRDVRNQKKIILARCWWRRLRQLGMSSKHLPKLAKGYRKNQNYCSSSWGLSSARSRKVRILPWRGKTGSSQE